MNFNKYIFKPIDKKYQPVFKLNGDIIDCATAIRIYRRLNRLFKYGTDIERNGVENYKAYKIKCDMFRRCYTYKHEVDTKRAKIGSERGYENCFVSSEWLKYEDFEDWINLNWYELTEGKISIDKDIMIPGNIMYGPKTCLLIPLRINEFFVNSIKARNIHMYRGDARYRSSVKDFYTGKIIHISGNNLDEAIYKTLDEKNRQLKENVIPYFNKIVHPDYKDSPMVNLVRDTLNNFDFHNIKLMTEKDLIQSQAYIDHVAATLEIFLNIIVKDVYNNMNLKDRKQFFEVADESEVKKALEDEENEALGDNENFRFSLLRPNGLLQLIF